VYGQGCSFAVPGQVGEVYSIAVRGWANKHRRSIGSGQAATAQGIRSEKHHRFADKVSFPIPKLCHLAHVPRTEHIEQAQKRDANIKASAAIPQTNDQVAQPLKIEGITYHEINFNGSAFSRMLMSKLSWLEFFRLAGLMLFGHRLDAIKIIAPHMEEMGLVGLATNSMDVCKREVKQVFDVLADEQSWPVLVHCTQGKDRTGLIVMLLHFLLGVDEAAIDEDYRLSESELAPEKEQRMKEIQSIGLTEQFAVCPPDVVSSVHSHIKEKYGTTEQYLEYTGISKEAVANVKRILSVGDT
jgi:protein-tyrosine phosphatase